MSEINLPGAAVFPTAPERAAKDEPGFTERSNGVAGGYEILSPEDILAIEHIVTEDDTPVDNLFSEKQRRLLTRSLSASWQGPGSGRPFLVASDVGVFRVPKEPPLVPDVFLSVDVIRPTEWWTKEGRSYFIWHYKKPPDVVIEVVSNTEGGETDVKFERYAHFGVPYYVIFDPQRKAQKDLLRAYARTSSGVYADCSTRLFPGVGLGLQLWKGEFEGAEAAWLRWYDASGVLIQTGEEKAEQERNRAKQERNRARQERNRAEQAENRVEQERSKVEQERNRAKQERNRAEQERNRAEQAEDRNERLAAQLRALGVTPEDGDQTM